MFSRLQSGKNPPWFCKLSKSRITTTAARQAATAGRQTDTGRRREGWRLLLVASGAGFGIYDFDGVTLAVFVLLLLSCLVSLLSFSPGSCLAVCLDLDGWPLVPPGWWR